MFSKTRLPNTFTLYCKSKSSLSFSESSVSIPNFSTEISEDTHIEIPNDLVYPEETQIEIPMEKIFIPPETDISSGSAPLSKRILRGSNIVLSKYARDAQVLQAEFVKSSVTTEDCPTDGLPEFALVGRSNVGKSSLVNSIVRRKKLALTSKKPGSDTPTEHQNGVTF